MAANDSSKLQRLLMCLFYYYSIIIGMTSYRYDYKTKTYGKTCFSGCQAIIANILVVLLLPSISWFAVHSLDDVPQSHRLMMYINRVQVWIQCLTILYTVLYRYKREKAMVKACSEMLQLECEYVSRWSRNANIERKFDRLFYIKYLLMVYQGFIVVLSAQTDKRRWYWYTYTLAFLLYNALCIQHIVVFAYFLAMAYVCRGLCYVSVRLRELLRQTRTLAAEEQQPQWDGTLRRATRQQLCDELQQLQEAHSKLVRIMRQLNRIYRFQMLAVRFACLITNVSMGYFGFIFTFSAARSETMMRYGSFTYYMLLLDLYLVDLVCDMALRQELEIARVMRHFNTVALCCDVGLTNAVEQFSIRLSSLPLRVNICGLYDVDKSLWFNMFSATLSYTVVLVQFHIHLSKEAGVPI